MSAPSTSRTGPSPYLAPVLPRRRSKRPSSASSNGRLRVALQGMSRGEDGLGSEGTSGTAKTSRPALGRREGTLERLLATPVSEPGDTPTPDRARDRDRSTPVSKKGSSSSTSVSSGIGGAGRSRNGQEKRARPPSGTARRTVGDGAAPASPSRPTPTRSSSSQNIGSTRAGVVVPLPHEVSTSTNTPTGTDSQASKSRQRPPSAGTAGRTLNRGHSRASSRANTPTGGGGGTSSRPTSAVRSRSRASVGRPESATTSRARRPPSGLKRKSATSGQLIGTDGRSLSPILAPEGAGVQVERVQPHDDSPTSQLFHAVFSSLTESLASGKTLNAWHGPTSIEDLPSTHAILHTRSSIGAGPWTPPPDQFFLRQLQKLARSDIKELRDLVLTQARADFEAHVETSADNMRSEHQSEIQSLHRRQSYFFKKLQALYCRVNVDLKMYNARLHTDSKVLEQQLRSTLYQCLAEVAKASQSAAQELSVFAQHVERVLGELESDLAWQAFAARVGEDLLGAVELQSLTKGTDTWYQVHDRIHNMATNAGHLDMGSVEIAHVLEIAYPHGHPHEGMAGTGSNSGTGAGKGGSSSARKSEPRERIGKPVSSRAGIDNLLTAIVKSGQRSLANGTSSGDGGGDGGDGGEGSSQSYKRKFAGDTRKNPLFPRDTPMTSRVLSWLCPSDIATRSGRVYYCVEERIVKVQGTRSGQGTPGNAKHGAKFREYALQSQVSRLVGDKNCDFTGGTLIPGEQDPIWDADEGTESEGDMVDAVDAVRVVLGKGKSIKGNDDGDDDDNPDATRIVSSRARGGRHDDDDDDDDDDDNGDSNDDGTAAAVTLHFAEATVGHLLETAFFAEILALSPYDPDGTRDPHELNVADMDSRSLSRGDVAALDGEYALNKTARAVLSSLYVQTAGSAGPGEPARMRALTRTETTELFTVYLSRDPNLAPCALDIFPGRVTDGVGIASTRPWLTTQADTPNTPELDSKRYTYAVVYNTISAPKGGNAPPPVPLYLVQFDKDPAHHLRTPGPARHGTGQRHRQPQCEWAGCSNIIIPNDADDEEGTTGSKNGEGGAGVRKGGKSDGSLAPGLCYHHQELAVFADEYGLDVRTSVKRSIPPAESVDGNPDWTHLVARSPILSRLLKGKVHADTTQLVNRATLAAWTSSWAYEPGELFQEAAADPSGVISGGAGVKEMREAVRHAERILQVQKRITSDLKTYRNSQNVSTFAQKVQHLLRLESITEPPPPNQESQPCDTSHGIIGTRGSHGDPSLFTAMQLALHKRQLCNDVASASHAARTARLAAAEKDRGRGGSSGGHGGGGGGDGGTGASTRRRAGQGSARTRSSSTSRVASSRRTNSQGSMR